MFVHIPKMQFIHFSFVKLGSKFIQNGQLPIVQYLIEKCAREMNTIKFLPILHILMVIFQLLNTLLDKLQAKIPKTNMAKHDMILHAK